MDKDQEEIRFALGVLDDYRRLIAAGKTQRWDVVKWAVTINTALTAASIALWQQQSRDPGPAGRSLLLLAYVVAVIAALLVLEVNRGMTCTRRGSRKPEKFLCERRIDVSKITESDPNIDPPFLARLSS